ncbi:MAG: methyl-accepting chemotaxis protein [Desulfarculus sp.]|jgi:methyl-accepting chemotaxis protein|nr:MAG: methyl-accepting chemotaxis protein [Desulfarculus sp.]
MADQVECRRRRWLFFYRDFRPGFVWGLAVAGAAILLPLLFSSLIMLLLTGRQSIPDMFPLLLYLNLIAVLALLVLAYWVALCVSHRMGGPLYRLQDILRSLGQGYLNQRVRLRENDQLQGFALSLNQALGAVQERVERLRTETLELQRQAEKEQAPAELRQQIERLRATLDDLFVL